MADNVVIESSLMRSSIVEEGVSIGPFAHLRPKVTLKKLRFMLEILWK